MVSTLLALAISGATLASAPGDEAAPDAARTYRNILLITLDTTRADHLGCYGHRRQSTPTLDALAADSAVFDQAIAQAAVTPVSHASIMTGRTLDSPTVTRLRSLGYAQ